MVLAKVFRVQYAEVASAGWMAACSSFIFPRASAHHGSDSNLQQGRSGAYCSQQEAEIFNNFARVKTRQHLRNHQTDRAEAEVAQCPLPIQKLMSVPILDPNSTVLGVLQISRKVWTPRASRRTSAAKTFTIWNLPAGLLAASPVMLAKLELLEAGSCYSPGDGKPQARAAR